MTQKIVNVSEIEGYLRDIENIANVLPIRALLDQSPSVSGEAVAEVIKDTNNMKEIVFNAHHWTHILKVGDKLYTTSQPDIVAELQAKIDKLMIEYCPNEMTKEQLDNWAKHQALVTTKD